MLSLNTKKIISCMWIKHQSSLLSARCNVECMFFLSCLHFSAFPILLKNSKTECHVTSALAIKCSVFSYDTVNPNKQHKTKTINSLSNLVATGTASISPSYPTSFSFANASAVFLHASSFPPAVPSHLHKRKSALWCDVLLRGPDSPGRSSPTAGGCLSIDRNMVFFRKSFKAALDPMFLWRLLFYTHACSSAHAQTLFSQKWGPPVGRSHCSHKASRRQAVPTMRHLWEGEPARTKKQHRCLSNSWVYCIVSHQGTDVWAVGKARQTSQHCHGSGDHKMTMKSELTVRTVLY